MVRVAVMARTTKQNEAQSDSQGSDIQALKTDVALIQQDMKYQSAAVKDLRGTLHDVRLDIQKLNYVPMDMYTNNLQSQKELMARFDDKITKIEDWIDDNSSGVSLSTKLADKWQTLLITLIITAVVGASAYNFIVGGA